MIWPASGSLAFNAAEPLSGLERGHACDDAPLYRWMRERTVRDVTARVRAWATEAQHPARAMGTIAGLEVAQASSSGRPGVYEVIDQQKRRYRIRADDLRVALNDARSGLLRASDRLPGNDFEFEIVGEKLTIRGRGFGHGVGLCQYCAAQWASEGHGALEMLGAFFPGASVRKAY